MACALVATWWAGPSQRRLFSSVSIQDDNLQRWMDGVVTSGSKARLLEYVRSLWQRHKPQIGPKYRIRNLPQDSQQYYSALRSIQTLTLVHTRVENIGEEGFRACFSAFRETLTFLFLGFCDMSFSAFVALVDYFPNITTLRMCLCELEPDEGPVPILSRPLRGKAYIQYGHFVTADCLAFFRRFAELDSEYEELVFDTFYHDPSEVALLLNNTLRISTTTVKFLRLFVEFERE